MSLYHRGLENTVFDDVLARLLASDAQVVLLPRTPEQAAVVRGAAGVIIPARPVDGPSLVWAADAVISAGGTMNREAAVLGVPTWTTFAGELGAVDRWLIEQGRMRVLERAEDLVIAKREPVAPGLRGPRRRRDRGDPAGLSPRGAPRSGSAARQRLHARSA